MHSTTKFAMLFLSKCVCACNISIDVKLLLSFFLFHIARGCRAQWKLHPTKLSTCAGSRVWSTLCTWIFGDLLSVFDSTLIACEGIQFPTSLQWSISCLVQLPWWLRQGAMDPLEGTFLKVNVDRPDFRTHIFNLVIRPSKAKQSVFRLCTFCNVALLPLSMWPSDMLTPAEEVSLRTARDLLAQAFEETHSIRMPQEGTCFPGVVIFFFWWFPGELEHLIRLNLNSCFCPCGMTDYRPLEGVTRDLLGTNWILLLVSFCCFAFRHQLVLHSSPNFSPATLYNLSWGLGVCSVLVRSVSPCRLVLEVSLFPSPCAVLAFCPSFVPAFSLPFAFQGWPGSGRVCVCVSVCVPSE